MRFFVIVFWSTFLNIFLSTTTSNDVMALSFQSKDRASTVVELYTSEGCSSCPPADAWVSNFTDHPNLFTDIIPIAFHVDYWDYIGWKDPFAREAHSIRQRLLKHQGIIRSVYTPGFVVNSKEWRSWFLSGAKNLPESDRKPGVLQAEIIEDQLKVKFNATQTLTINIAYLGMGIESTVTAGENKSRILSHDFVVLDMWQKEGKQQWNIDLKPIPDKGQQQTALVVWLSKPDSFHIIQAAGTFLPN